MNQNPDGEGFEASPSMIAMLHKALGSDLLIATLPDRRMRGLLLQLNPNLNASHMFRLRFPGRDVGVVCICCIAPEQVASLPKLLESKPDLHALVVRRADIWRRPSRRAQNTSAKPISDWPSLGIGLKEIDQEELNLYQHAINQAVAEHDRMMQEDASQVPLVLMARLISKVLGGLIPPRPEDELNKDLVYGFRDEPEEKSAEEEQHVRRTRYRPPTLRDAFKKGRKR